MEGGKLRKGLVKGKKGKKAKERGREKGTELRRERERRGVEEYETGKRGREGRRYRIRGLTNKKTFP